MRYAFIINPISGKKRRRKKLMDEISAISEELKLDYEIYLTTAPLDCKRYVRELCEKASSTGEHLRIYGCGGDGTVNELVNGAYGFENVEIGVVPMGTGNDYIRNYAEKDDFVDIKRQITGQSQWSDLIYYRGEYNECITEGYCANMFNIGFDCNVVDMTSRVKKLPFIKGSIAYLVSVGIILMKKKGADLKIEYDDGTVKDGKILLIAIANGCFCGGGVKGVPDAITDDGLMDVSVINDVSRRTFMLLFPSYSKGTHLSKKRIIDREIIKYSKEKTLTIEANDGSLRLCTDGEITTQKKVSFSIVEKGFRFIVPKNREDSVHIG